MESVPVSPVHPKFSVLYEQAESAVIASGSHEKTKAEQRLNRLGELQTVSFLALLIKVSYGTPFDLSELQVTVYKRFHKR